MSRPRTPRPVPPGAVPLARAAALLASLLLALPPAAPAGAAPARPAPHEAAMAADAFVDTIGVNLQLGAGGVWDRLAGGPAPALRRAGIRFVRAAAGPAGDPSWRRLRELAAAGFRVDLVVGADTDWEGLAPAAASLGRALAAVEGSDAPAGDRSLLGRADGVRQRLWRLVRSTPALRDVPVLGPEPGVFADQRAVRLDLGGRCPGCGPPPGGDRPQVTEATLEVPEPVADRYLPRLWLEQATRAGRTYLDGLVGDGPRAGLLRPDGSPTGAYRTMANLVALLADAGPAPAAARLDYRLSGDTRGLHQLLLARSGGRFDLALWLEAPSWAPPSGRPLEPPARRVTLTLGAPVRRARVFRPDRGTTPLAEVEAGTAIALAVPDRVLLVELAPGAPRGAAAARPAGAPAPAGRAGAGAAAAGRAPAAGRPARAARAGRAVPGAAAGEDPLAFTGGASLSLLAASLLLVLVALAALSGARRRRPDRR
jgi:hypothetical protein